MVKFELRRIVPCKATHISQFDLSADRFVWQRDNDNFGSYMIAIIILCHTPALTALIIKMSLKPADASCLEIRGGFLAY